ncbi:bifunctional DNA-formamidopyrimidine glycosylase/DNA-(apurinic or apyrimidinic site) lyase [Aestuariivirga sp.]|uniref:bifunctional DNA-formamidopyrimidine glycosylase/DNA-(apurinic or apyrimidinic site) lyase n=1 Tax=Aestuariivirga sp. TaxID=2650926 RepID=UPI0039E24D1E
MPELPEVETVMRGLEPVLAGQRIAAVETRRSGLRFPFPERFRERLEGRTVTGLRRRAKYILAALDDGASLLIHLGMTGRFTVLKRQGPASNLGEFYFETGAGEQGNGPHDHVLIRLGDETRIVYTDPRRFGVMDIVEADGRHPLLDGIGIEPLGNELDAMLLKRAFTGKRAPLKAALLDQSIVAGLGNIYVCEALYRARLSPARKASTLARGKSTDPRLEELVRHIRAVLQEAIAAGGSTLQDFAHTDGASGAFQQRFAVYDREGEPCPSCGSPLKRKVQAGRSTFYCQACQK